MIDNAAWIAFSAHGARRQMYDGKPYFYHVEGVAEAFADEDRKTVAYLHDVVEDTDVTLEHLATLFPAHIVAGVDAMTHREGESYKEYLNRVAADPLAIHVKLADLRFNLRHPGKPHLTPKYKRAIQYLTDAYAAKRDTCSEA
jgi:(p)ppGpp synthase/HD superfamily hydrolase